MQMEDEIFKFNTLYVMICSIYNDNNYKQYQLDLICVPFPSVTRNSLLRYNDLFCLLFRIPQKMLESRQPNLSWMNVVVSIRLNLRGRQSGWGEKAHSVTVLNHVRKL